MKISVRVALLRFVFGTCKSKSTCVNEFGYLRRFDYEERDAGHEINFRSFENNHASVFTFT